MSYMRAEGLNALHDLDRRSGAGEMNALLSLVLSMGPNRVAGALRCGAGDVLSSDDEPRARAPAPAAPVPSAYPLTVHPYRSSSVIL